MQDNAQTFSLAAKRFFSGSAISRVFGFFRELLMALCFGTSPSVAGFWMAYRFAQLGRRVFGEGALNLAFIPHYEMLRKQNPASAARFYKDLSSYVTLLLVVLILILEGAMTLWRVKGGCLAQTEEILWLTQLLLPALIPIVLYALSLSFLNCHQSFFLPSLAPVFLNLFWIVLIAGLYRMSDLTAMRGLALGLNGAFWLQWAVTYPKTRSLLKGAALEKTSWKQIGALLRPFSLAVLGVTATQINSALDAIFAQLADPQGPALLWYALRFQQLPLALIGLATATALLPPLTRAYQSQDLEKAATFFKLAIKQAFQSMVPLTGMLIVLAEPMIKLVYQHGAFTSQAAYLTAQCLKGYALGLLPMSLVMILAAPFYANKDYLTVAKLSVGTVVLNMALNACMVYGFKTGAAGIALATALSAWFNVAALLWIDKKKIFDRSFLKTTAITCLAGALAHLVVVGVKIQAPLGSLLIQLSSGAMTYLVLFALLAKGTKIRFGVLRIRKPSEY